MRKTLFRLFSIICLLSFTSCSEEESPLLFSVEYISNPENVNIEYFSPDPKCVSKQYYIDANNCNSEISIKCINSSPVYIEDSKGRRSKRYISADGQWKAESVDSNTITFTFNDVDETLIEDEYGYAYGGIMVVSYTNDGKLTTCISVSRLLRAPETTPVSGATPFLFY